MAASAPFEADDANALKKMSMQDVEALLPASYSQLLGSGSYGCVYTVDYEGQTCVLKVPHCAGDSSLRREMELLQRIAGAGGAPVPLAFCPESHALLMSFCGKASLKQHLSRGARSGGFSLQHVLCLALRVTERLLELHRAGFVHCDLNCNNVTVKLDAARKLESVHIIDYGLSARIGERRPPRTKPEWYIQCYCDCTYNGSPILPLCDLPGLGTVF